MKKTILSTAIALLTLGTAEASTFNFNYQATSQNYFEAINGDFGQQVSLGDTVNLSLKALNGQSFSGGSSIWAIQGFEEYGTRSANYSYSFLYNGNVVATGTTSQNTSAIHMGPNISIPTLSLWNELQWSGVLSGSTATGNTTTNIMQGDVGRTSNWQYGYTDASLVLDPNSHANLAAVPVPGAAWLFGSALLTLVGVKRKKATA